jgi:dipeptidase E
MARLVRSGAARLNIVAIGGGSVGQGETEALDWELIRLTRSSAPRVLFIPTASNDDEGYIAEFTRAYTQLGCQVDALSLHSNDDPSKIHEADAVYVGGGNTKMMLEIWRAKGVDRLLRAHAEQGKPVGGLSAGALCWFRVGNSDWPQYEGIPGVNTARLDCLGWVDLVLCPHTRDEGFRLGEFREMMRGERGPGVGLDDGCAIQIKDGSYRILSSIEGSVAHRIEWIENQVHESVIEPHDDYRPLSSL